jgi:hypothetical protein
MMPDNGAALGTPSVLTVVMIVTVFGQTIRSEYQNTLIGTLTLLGKLFFMLAP